MGESQHTNASSRTRGNDPSESDKPEADVIAEALAMAATEIGEVCSEITGRAHRGSWRWPFGRAALEQIEQDMAVLKARLEEARDMG